MQNFVYDAAGRLVSAVYATNTFSYAYDNAGNPRLLSSPRPALLLGPVITNQFTLYWPAAPAEFVLETSSTLGTGAVWSANVGGTPVLSGDFLTVSLPINSSAQFYRLHKP
jgi:hypothetical protein